MSSNGSQPPATAREDSQPRGIECRNCGCRHFEVTHTEPLACGMIRRRRTCRHCGRKLVTYEGAASVVVRRRSRS